MLLLLVLFVAWCRLGKRITVPKAIAAIGGTWLLLLGGAMVVSPWCPFSAALVEKKRDYAHIIGGLFVLAFGFDTLRFAFAKMAPREDGGATENTPDASGGDAGTPA